MEGWNCHWQEKKTVGGRGRMKHYFWDVKLQVSIWHAQGSASKPLDTIWVWSWGEEGFWAADVYWGVICTSKSWYLKLRLVRCWVEIEKGNQEDMTLGSSSSKRLRWRGRINKVNWGCVSSEVASKPRDRGILNAESKKEYEGVGEVWQMLEQKNVSIEHWALNLDA